MPLFRMTCRYIIDKLQRFQKYKLYNYAFTDKSVGGDQGWFNVATTKTPDIQLQHSMANNSSICEFGAQAPLVV